MEVKFNSNLENSPAPKSPESQEKNQNSSGPQEKNLSPSDKLTTSNEQALEIEDWSCIDYQLALQRQMEEVEAIAKEDKPGKIIFCTHPAVVTTGRATQSTDVFDWKGPIIEVSRGGRATYHGPEQIVIYPLVNLKKARRGRGVQDIAGLMRDLELAIVASLQQFGIHAIGKSYQKNRNGENHLTGVWIENFKVASLGLAIRQWVSFHGAAINFEMTDLSFHGIHPCGFSSEIMTSVCQHTKVSRSDFELSLKRNLQKYL